MSPLNQKRYNGKRMPSSYMASHMATLLCTAMLLSANFLSANNGFAFTPPEIAAATFSCVSKWDELCEDQQTLAVPEGYKICSKEITVIEEAGKNQHEVLAEDEHSVTVKFSAIGNQDRIRQKDSLIKLQISLRGVKQDEECNPKPKKAIAKLEPQALDACACSPLIEAENVSKCLTEGEGVYGVKCDLSHVDIICVTSKEQCREHHRKTCSAVISMDKTKSKKRLFVKNSPFCKE